MKAKIILIFAAFLLGMFPATVLAQYELQFGDLKMTLNEETGAILQITDLASEREYLDGASRSEHPPFALFLVRGIATANESADPMVLYGDDFIDLDFPTPQAIPGGWRLEWTMTGINTLEQRHFVDPFKANPTYPWILPGLASVVDVDITVSVDVLQYPGHDAVKFENITVTLPSGQLYEEFGVYGIRLPILYGLKELETGLFPPEDVLAWPDKDGKLLREPFRHVIYDEPPKEKFVGAAWPFEFVPRLRMNYPGGHGMNMQFFEYFVDDWGNGDGLYIGTHDPDLHKKTFVLEPQATDAAKLKLPESEASWRINRMDIQIHHWHDDVCNQYRPVGIPTQGYYCEHRQTYTWSYPTVIKLLRNGNWFEGADFYREEFAWNAPWANRLICDRTGISNEFFTNTAFSVFGMSSTFDFTSNFVIQQLSLMADAAGGAVLFAPTWDWHGPTYFDEGQGNQKTDYLEWFPASMGNTPGRVRPAKKRGSNFGKQFASSM